MKRMEQCHRTWVLRAWAAIAAMVAFGGMVRAAGKVERPAEAVEWKNCVTAECHVNIKGYKALHGPVNVNTCDACHEVADAKAHTFRFTRQKAELCTFCHEFNTGNMPVVHMPVVKGECTGCHDPHGGSTTTLLRADSVAELCGRCHESITRDKKHLHTPVKEGSCDVCHTSHASKYPKLVNAAGSELCTACHSDMKGKLARSKFTHKALEEGCTKCHDIHGSNTAMALTQPVPDLCIECHEKVKKEADEAKYKHTVTLADRACVTCHTSHGGDLAKLMRDLPAVVCMDCHNGKAQGDGGRVIAAVPEISDPNMRKHGPIREGQCSGCHGPHGTNRPNLLTMDYSRSFYQPFSEEQYKLCFSCHESKLIQQAQGKDVTKFRNGEKNLHYVHVIKATRGHSCSVCHSTHAGTNDRHVREAVPFGKWNIPVGYQLNETGGTCFSGCHATYAYDRENAVEIPTTGPATQPAPMIPRPDYDKPMLVKWEGKDVAGHGVKVPEAKRPSVLLFVRGEESATTQQLFKLVTAGVGEASVAQVVVILSGAQAKEKAAALGQQTPWTIIADAENQLSKQLGVYVWPATLVVQSDGKQVAHIGGTPPPLSMDLAAYLDFANGKVDRAALNQRLASNQLLHDEPMARATRQLKIAEHMLEEGKTEQARRLLTDALKLQLESVPLKVGMVKTLEQLKRQREALDLLNKLPAGALPAGEMDLLRGRLLMALGRWEEAKRSLSGALKVNKQLREAHYLLGQVYEHEKEWQKSAQEYRAAQEERGKENR